MLTDKHLLFGLHKEIIVQNKYAIFLRRNTIQLKRISQTFISTGDGSQTHVTGHVGSNSARSLTTVEAVPPRNPLGSEGKRRVNGQTCLHILSAMYLLKKDLKQV